MCHSSYGWARVRLKHNLHLSWLHHPCFEWNRSNSSATSYSSCFDATLASNALCITRLYWRRFYSSQTVRGYPCDVAPRSWFFTLKYTALGCSFPMFCASIPLVLETLMLPTPVSVVLHSSSGAISAGECYSRRLSLIRIAS